MNKTDLTMQRATDPVLVSIYPELAERWQNTQEIVAKTDHLNAIWCRSRSAWSLEHITLTMGGSAPIKRMRQISAEIESRRAAMLEAKYGLLRMQVEIERSQTRLLAEKDAHEKRLLEIEIAEKEERIASILVKFNGAMKDVADLGRLYDNLSREFGEITEENVAAAEYEANLHRAITQAIRDVRQIGTISYGNQEYLEQCGANPSMCIEVIRAYVDAERGLASGWKKKHENFVQELIQEISKNG